MIIVSMLSFLTFIITVFLEFIYVIKVNRIEIISYVRLFFSFVNFLLPSFVGYLIYSKSYFNDFIYDITDASLSIIYIIAIISYILLSLGYHNRLVHNMCASKCNYVLDQSRLLKYVYIIFGIGFISLIIWTSAYGSIGNFAANAAIIRSGYGDVYNKYAFFKQFAKYLNLSFVISGMFFLYKAISDNKGIMSYCSALLITIFSGIGSVLFLLCSDARGPFAGCLLVIAMGSYSFYCNKKKVSASKQLFIIGSIVICIFLLASSLSELANVLRYDSGFDSKRYTFMDRILNEFIFVTLAQNKVLNVLFSNSFEYKFFDEILGAALSWIPSRFKPFEEPMTLWQYNTILIKGYDGKGTLPTDIISSSIYYFNIIGPLIVLPLFGCVIRLIENKISSIPDVFIEVFFKSYMTLFLVFLVSHFMFRSIVYENLTVAIALYLLFKVCRKKTR